MATLQANKSEITLKGSTKIVSEYLVYACNLILYLREIYPSTSFKTVKKYDMPLHVAADPALKEFLTNVISQLRRWMNSDEVDRLVLVITGVESQEVLERWVFKIITEDQQNDENNTNNNNNNNNNKAPKTLKQVQKEIQAIIRQIMASVGFLPLIEETCTFDLLVYTDIKTNVPEKWAESGPRNIVNGNSVKLRSFSTSQHTVDSMVAFKMDE